ncbi:CAP domain-containing protein [Rhizobiales bacterium]|nr:CAP domain-containing protein [Hongsoonwoonella zoysiae]
MAIGLLLTACASFRPGADDAEVVDVPVDGPAALANVNAYRSSRGLHALSLDPRLNEVSREMAHLIARHDSLDVRAHSASGLARRLDGSGYENYAGAENLGAGYRDFDAALAGWKGSKDHDKNLLNPYVTRVGFARTRRSDGKWRNFWVMILSRPKEDGPPDVD